MVRAMKKLTPAPQPRFRVSGAATLLIAVLLLTGCSGQKLWLPGLKVPATVQGNLFDLEALQRLELGMSRPQVRHILGTPMLRDAFHNDRWDYIYHRHTGGKPEATYHVVLHFEADQLRKIDYQTPRDELPERLIPSVPLSPPTSRPSP